MINVNRLVSLYKYYYPCMEKVFDAADKYGIGIYPCLNNRNSVIGGGKSDKIWLLAAETFIKRFAHRHSFLGYDNMNEALQWKTNNEDKDYVKATYDVLRKYHKNALFIISNLNWTWEVINSPRWPRLANATGVVIDSHYYIDENMYNWIVAWEQERLGDKNTKMSDDRFWNLVIKFET